MHGNIALIDMVAFLTIVNGGVLTLMIVTIGLSRHIKQHQVVVFSSHESIDIFELSIAFSDFFMHDKLLSGRTGERRESVINWSNILVLYFRVQIDFYAENEVRLLITVTIDNGASATRNSSITSTMSSTSLI